MHAFDDWRVDAWLNSQEYLPEYRTCNLGTHVGDVDGAPWPAISGPNAEQARDNALLIRLVFEARAAKRLPWIVLRDRSDPPVRRASTRCSGVISPLQWQRQAPVGFNVVRAFRDRSTRDQRVSSTFDRIAALARGAATCVEQSGHTRPVVAACLLVEAPLFLADFGTGSASIGVRRLDYCCLQWTSEDASVCFDLVQADSKRDYQRRIRAGLKSILAEADTALASSR
jgi:hypothetical protein